MSKSVVTIVDYGIGNIRSIEKAFESQGAGVFRTDRPQDISRADRLVVPGVGAFGSCINEIRKRGLEEPIREFASSGKPFLGVCVGMQLLFEYSVELGRHGGLRILPGSVVRFSDSSLKIPHMGWNSVQATRESQLLYGVEKNAFFYFVHSYYAVPKESSDVLGLTRYSVDFPAVVNRNNVFGVQFHPEKSQSNGLRVLKNFSEI